jgi:hypothetical protein
MNFNKSTRIVHLESRQVWAFDSISFDNQGTYVYVVFRNADRYEHTISFRVSALNMVAWPKVIGTKGFYLVTPT